MPIDTQEGTWLETDSVSQGRWKGQRPPSPTRWVLALVGATEGQLVELCLGHLALFLTIWQEEWIVPGQEILCCYLKWTQGGD